ncbi:hypothetical protein INT47_000188 [Mucor saturninus]|uniref:Septin-type G domain-containing protein n=1 Tax=Mucor saturninus TaxID=64648 RepID=A0A8H7R2X3_9FUNG|nr:hypothetical protein INT47_000188 [Mucor saturninus]
MVVGSAGSGKTAFIRTFCETLTHDVIQGSYRESKSMVLNDPLQPTTELYTVSMHIQEQGQRTALTLIDTPGFTTGVAVDHQLRYIAKYIDYQFERTLAEESKVKRDAKALDTHIHSCLYFIDIQSINGLSEADRYILQNLSTRVNIVPVIGKSDTLTVAQCNQLKTVFRREIFDILQIPIYGYIEVDEDEDMFGKRTSTKGYHPSQRTKILDMLHECVEEDNDEDASAMIDYLQSMPFTLIGYEEDTQTGRPINIKNSSNSDSSFIKEQEDEEMQDSPTPVTRKKEFIKNKQIIKSVLGRSYPWAVVECCNPTHCDFETLKKALLSGHKDMLRIDTFERFYEQYRTTQLQNRTINRSRTGSKQGMHVA